MTTAPRLGLAIALIVFSALNAIAQTHAPLTRGLPFIRSYDRSDYDASNQNWAVAISATGLLYVANASELLEYNGVSWRKLPELSLQRVYAVVAGPQGRMFVGTASDFGELNVDETGLTRYQSLRDRLDNQEGSFGSIRQILPTSDHVFFRSASHIIAMQRRDTPPVPTDFTVWAVADTEGTAFDQLAWHQEQLIGAVRGRGLMRLSADGFTPWPGTQQLGQFRPTQLLSQADGSLLVCTLDDGLFRLRGDRLTPLTGPINEFALRNRPTSCTDFQEGMLLITTLNGGAASFDQHGELQQIIDQDAGLRENWVSGAPAIDRRGAYWFALGTGLARIELGFSAEVFDERVGLRGGLTSIVRHNARLYVGTTQGLLRLEPGLAHAPAQLLPFSQTPDAVWALASFEGRLVASFDRYVAVVAESGEITPILKGLSTTLVTLDKRLYVGTSTDGVHAIESSGTQLTDLGRIGNTSNLVRRIVPDGQGHLWLRAFYGVEAPAERIERIHESARPVAGQAPHVIGEHDGLPQGTRVYPFMLAERLMVWIDGEIFQRDPVTGLFSDTQDPVLQSVRGVAMPVRDRAGRWWFARSNGSIARLSVAKSDATLDVQMPVPDYLSHTTVLLYSDPEDDSVWTDNYDTTLVRYRAGETPNVDWSPNLIISGLSAQGLGRVPLAGTDQPTTLAYENNAVQVAFAVTDAPAEGEYRARLVGLNEQWGEWSAATTREYQALREGRYRFEVQARDSRGTTSTTATTSFVIRAPWFRQVWAYLLYVAGTTALFGALYYWRLHRLRRRIVMLDQHVFERDQAQEKLLKYQRKLRQLASELSLAEERARRNTAADLHDGAGQLLAASLLELGAAQNLASPAQSAHLHKLRRHISDALRRIRNISVDLSPPQLHNLGFAAAARWWIDKIANEHPAILFELKCDLPPLSLSPDTRIVLFQALRELTQNAIKHGHGQILEVLVERRGDEVELIVIDNGCGFDPSQLDMLPTNSGGFGLFNIHERISMLEGNIEIESVPDKGTRIRVRVPMHERRAQLRDGTT